MILTQTNLRGFKMLRYHKKVYTILEHKELLESITEQLNSEQWSYSEHCLDTLKYRVLDIENVLLFIKALTLRAKNIFEYYLTDNGQAEKICYRISYNKTQDIILILSKDKKIISIYLNAVEDEHFTLKKELYVQG